MKIPSLGEVPHQVRERLEDVPAQVRAWREGVRTDPGQFLRSPLLRIGLLILGAVILVIVVQWLATGLAPPDVRSQFEDATPTATLYVACTAPGCGHAYTTQQDRGFQDWPLTCEKCARPSVYRAQLCPACKNWSAAAAGQPWSCPRCAEQIRRTAPVTQPERRRERSDNDEDPWGG